MRHYHKTGAMVTVLQRCLRVSVILSLLFILIASSSAADVNQIEQQPSGWVHLYSIGAPLAAYHKDAQRINDLKWFQGRLYIGSGDAVVNTGPTDLIVYDPQSKSFSVDYTIDDEGIYTFSVIDNTLVIPGVDATESWDFGNVYVLEPDGWIKHRTIPRGIHVNDIVSFGGAWYASTGNVFDFKGEETYALGGIFRSSDRGRTWQFVYGTPCDETSVFRVDSLQVYQEKLYAFIYGFSEMKYSDIPEQFRVPHGDHKDSRDPASPAIIMYDDYFGPMDALVLEGKQWKLVDLLPVENISRVSPIVFKDTMLLKVLRGRFIDYLGLKDGLPPQAEKITYTWDGSSTHILPVQSEGILDILIRDDAIHMLITRKDGLFITVSNDVTTWSLIALPENFLDPRTLEFDGENYWIGTDRGSIYRSSEVMSCEGRSMPDREPRKVTASARYPENGLWSWVALSRWTRPGRPAIVDAALGVGNRIDVTTDNSDGFSLFPIAAGADPAKELILSIDGHETFRGRLNRSTELIAQRKNDGSWKVSRARGTPGSWKPNPLLIGRSRVELPRSGEGRTVGTWQAESLREALGVEVTIINPRSVKGPLKTGPITVEDLFRITSWETLAIGDLTAAELTAMLSYNATQQIPDRVIVSGITLSYDPDQGEMGGTLQKTDLDPNRSYRVALSGSLAKFAEDIFGQTLPSLRRSPFFTAEVLIDWLHSHHVIEDQSAAVK